MILRNRDAGTAWADEADSTREQRVYYCQNWRADVVALMTDAGAQVEQVRYEPYGSPFGIPAGDVDADGDGDYGDMPAVSGSQGDLIGDANYRADEDLDRDGAILPTGDTDDITRVQARSGKAKLTTGYISGPSDATGPDNQVGYCGSVASKSH